MKNVVSMKTPIENATKERERLSLGCLACNCDNVFSIQTDTHLVSPKTANFKKQSGIRGWALWPTQVISVVRGFRYAAVQEVLQVAAPPNRQARQALLNDQVPVLMSVQESVWAELRRRLG